MNLDATLNSVRTWTDRFRFRLLIGLVALVAVGLMAGCRALPSSSTEKTVPEVMRTQFMPPPDDIRDFRYCEIVPIFRSGVTFNVEVYNTIGLNECPADLWDALNTKEMAESYGAVDVKLNGPRYWVINKVVAEGKTAVGKTVDFNGIEMNLGGVIETKLWEGTVGGKLYTENEVQRTTTFTYNAGEMVYELISADGEVYRMQSYAQMIDPTLTTDDLERLGDRLTLPEGWRYEARILTEESLLIADGLAFVINDDFGNSYQKVLGDELATTAMRADENSRLEYHDGYWVTKVDVPDRPIALTVINDMHIDAATKRATVYAQSKILGRIVSPPQVGPGECTEDSNGETVCFHPDAVYLNGSGQELMEADGTGEWWVKHAWILGGDGYDNCEMSPQESYDDCIWVKGVLLDDGLTMQVGGIIDAETGAWSGNHRSPVFHDDGTVTYTVTRLAPTNLDPEAGEIDLTLKADWVLELTCEEKVSAFDNRARECPKAQN